MDRDKWLVDDTVPHLAIGGGTSEKGLGIVDVLIRKRLDNQDFCLLLASDRVVLMRERSRTEILPGVFGYSSVHVREHDHPSMENMEVLDHDKDSLVIPYERLRSIHLRRGFSCSTMRREYILDLEYVDESGGARRLAAVVSPPQLPGGTLFGKRFDRDSAVSHAKAVRQILSEALADRSVFVSEI